MKYTQYTILLLVAVVAWGCKNALEKPLEFAVSVVASGEQPSLEQVDDTTFSAEVGTQVTFLFDGEPDFISLKYTIFNETKSVLSFDQMVAWNDNNDNLQLYIATDFPGLNLGDAHADSALIRNHAWEDISERVEWGKVRNDTTHTDIDLNDYRGQNIVLAFRYHAESNRQPMFTLSNMQIQNTVVKTGEVVNTTTAQSMGWQPFDMLHLTPDSMAYRTGSDVGIWDVRFADLTDRTAIKLRQTAVNREANEDWLISRAIYVPRGKDDSATSLAVKNVYLNVDQYDFTFEEDGEYTITFYAANANYVQQEQTTRTYKFIIR